MARRHLAIDFAQELVWSRRVLWPESVDKADSLSGGWTAGTGQQPSGALYQAICDWSQELVIRQYAQRCPGDTIYSIVETAKENGLNPYAYLTYLFEKLPNLKSTSDEALDELLPWNVKIQ